MPLARLNEIDLYYEESGSGPPLLLIAGLGVTTLGWAMLEPALAQHFRVIAFDNRGAGRSAAPNGPYTTAQMAADAAALLAHLGIARAHVLGHSLGGMIAQELALTHPACVDRLVLYATAARLRPTIFDPFLSLWTRAAERDMAGDELSLALIPWMFTPAVLADHDQVEAILAAWANDPYPPSTVGLTAQAEAGRTHDARDRLAQISASTLVLVGADDIACPVATAQVLAEAIPDARLHVLERGGHLADVEDPDAVAAALLAFLTA